jgi:endoglucanase
MQVPPGNPLAGMVHHKIHDESWAAMPMTPPSEVDNDNRNEMIGTGRYLFPPSTAATLNLAATAAVCSRVWAAVDPDFSQMCLKTAETAWQAARENPQVFAGNTPGTGGGNYGDEHVEDEFFWVAVELFISTGKTEYRDYLVNSSSFGQVDSFDWSQTAAPGLFSLFTIPNHLSENELSRLKGQVLSFADRMVDIQNQDGYSVLISGDFPWGSNGQILNNMMLVALAYDLTGDEKYLYSVVRGMDYILGRNPMNQSYISGYGTYSMEHPHHRFWANDPLNGYPPPPPGALSGGPNSNPSDPIALSSDMMNLDQSKRYIDDIGSFSTNEVAINWNAPLVWIATWLDEHTR